MQNILRTYGPATTSGYGWRTINGVTDFHGGIDITGWNGYNLLDYIIAKADGKVVNVRKDCTGFEGGGSYGNFVHIDHGNGYSTVYAHLAYGSVCVNVGDTVKAGQVIGYMGATGTAYGGHLHFEVRHNNTRIDPTEYVYSKDIPASTPSTDPFQGVSDEELARRVWNGEFGNGADRVNALGSRYNAVQALVDQGIGRDEPAPTPSGELHVGDRVIIEGYGNGSSYGDSNRAGGIGWERQILAIYAGRRFPYQVGDSTGTTGFYGADALRKI